MKKNKKCPTKGKLVFETRGEAYDNSNRGLFGVPYECKCGKYHLTHKKCK